MGPDDPPDLSDEFLFDPVLFGQFGEELRGGDMPAVELASGLRRQVEAGAESVMKLPEEAF